MCFRHPGAQRFRVTRDDGRRIISALKRQNSYTLPAMMALIEMYLRTKCSEVKCVSDWEKYFENTDMQDPKCNEPVGMKFSRQFKFCMVDGRAVVLSKKLAGSLAGWEARDIGGESCVGAQIILKALGREGPGKLCNPLTTHHYASATLQTCFGTQYFSHPCKCTLRAHHDAHVHTSHRSVVTTYRHTRRWAW